MSATTFDGLRTRARARSVSLPYPELLALLVLAGALNLWGLSINGWANEYYSGAVRSMASSWHAFLYGSLDSAGVMTVDKPPLALWVQALSVRVFGWHSLSVLVPQALMGVASVGLVYDLTRRRFGRAGGFVAGAVLALTPIAVAVARHNNPDALLVLCVVGALWGVVRALEDGRVRWLAVAGACVGLGFEAKMGAALLVVPALFVAWVWAAPRNRVRGVVAGALAMLVCGGAWPLLMALTPASARPWISGTSDNSILSLILDYNGLGRLDGQAGGPQGMGGGGGGNGLFGGEAGPLRLLNEALGGQAGWLLGFALVTGVALVVATRLRRSDPVTGWVLAVGGSALTAAVAFSFAQGIFHPYYVSELAPFTACLVGAGVARFTRGDTLGRIAGPLAIAGGVITELVVLDGTLGWVPPLLVIAGVGAAAALALGSNARVRNAAIATAITTLLIAPAAWSVQTLGHTTNGTFPAGGPADAGGGFGGPGGARGGPPPSAGGGFAPGGNGAGQRGNGSGGGFAPGGNGAGQGGNGSGGGFAPGGNGAGQGGNGSGGGFAPGGNGAGQGGSDPSGSVAPGGNGAGQGSGGSSGGGAPGGGDAPGGNGAGQGSGGSSGGGAPGGGDAPGGNGAGQGSGGSSGGGAPGGGDAPGGNGAGQGSGGSSGGGAPGGGFAPGGNGAGPGGAGGGPGGGGPGGGGVFGGNSASLTAALGYIAQHGGGTLAVSSQSTAAAAIVTSNADIAGLGGFSGRESEISVSWLADQVRDGSIRWVLADGSGGGLRNDGRTGSTTAMAAVASTCQEVDVDGVTLYDCAGAANALAAAARD